MSKPRPRNPDITRYGDTLQRTCAIRLPRNEEIRLAVAAKAGDTASLHRLVESQLPWVLKLASGLMDTWDCTGIDFEDLIQEGNYGLLKSFKHYDPHRSRLSTYSYRSIMQAMRHFLWSHRKAIKVPPNPTCMSEKCRELAAIAQATVSFDALVERNRGCLNLYIDESDSEFPSSETMEGLSSIQADVWRAIHALDTEMQKDIIVRRMHGETFKSIGLSYGLTRGRIEQIEKIARKRLGELLHRRYAS